MKKIKLLREEINEISLRISDINKILDIYNLDDSESINSIKEELNMYKERLKKIYNEELK